MTIAHTPAHLQALCQALAIGLEKYPTETARLLRGFYVALDDKVTLGADGTHTVESDVHGKAAYRVGKTCTCQDYQYGQAPDGRCKHRWAAALVKKAQALETLALASCERRNTEAAAGNLAALVCDGNWRMRDGGRHEITAGT
jgi:SWIM zinc finger